MKIICNGETREVVIDTTLGKLIVDLDLNPETVVAECNGQIVKREDYDSLVLHDGCRLELIRFVGGG